MFMVHGSLLPVRSNNTDGLLFHIRSLRWPSFCMLSFLGTNQNSFTLHVFYESCKQKWMHIYPPFNTPIGLKRGKRMLSEHGPPGLPQHVSALRSLRGTTLHEPFGGPLSKGAVDIYFNGLTDWLKGKSRRNHRFFNEIWDCLVIFPETNQWISGYQWCLCEKIDPVDYPYRSGWRQN